MKPVWGRTRVNALRMIYVMALASVPRRFDEVKAITPSVNGQSLKLNARSGVSVSVRLVLAALGLGSVKPEPVV